MARIRISLLVLIVLGACGASPAPAFFGADRSDVTLRGIRFAVLRKGDAVEVIRLDSIARNRHEDARQGLIEAAEQATGCRVAGPLAGWSRSPSLPGDSAEARFRLRC